MSELRTPDDVLEQLPGWQGATWVSLDGGMSNRTYRLQKNDLSAVLKIDDQPRQAPLNSRTEEAAIQSVAAREGLANAVLHASEQLYLTVYEAGTVWGPASFFDDAKLESVACALRRLHSLPLSGRTFDAAAAARHYAGKIEGETVLVDACSKMIRSVRRPENLCCCHNDLVAENILSTPELRFLDWEYACDNDPLFDLATIVEHHRLDESRANLLLDVYFDGDGERWRAELRQQQQLYVALLWLWMASRPDSAEGELYQVAERLFTNYS